MERGLGEGHDLISSVLFKVGDPAFDVIDEELPQAGMDRSVWVWLIALRAHVMPPVPGRVELLLGVIGCFWKEDGVLERFELLALCNSCLKSQLTCEKQSCHTRVVWRGISGSVAIASWTTASSTASALASTSWASPTWRSIACLAPPLGRRCGSHRFRMFILRVMVLLRVLRGEGGGLWALAVHILHRHLDQTESPLLSFCHRVCRCVASCCPEPGLAQTERHALHETTFYGEDVEGDDRWK